MGETRYPLGENDGIRFGDERYSCLCTFPINNTDKKLGLGTVECFALLGAALCMYRNSGLDKNDYDYSYAGRHEYTIPECLPIWIRNEIRRVLGDYPEDIDSDYIIQFDTCTEEDEEKIYKQKLENIISWAQKELDEINKN